MLVSMDEYCQFERIDLSKFIAELKEQDVSFSDVLDHANMIVESSTDGFINNKTSKVLLEITYRLRQLGVNIDGCI